MTCMYIRRYIRRYVCGTVQVSVLFFWTRCCLLLPGTARGRPPYASLCHFVQSKKNVLIVVSQNIPSFRPSTAARHNPETRYHLYMLVRPAQARSCSSAPWALPYKSTKEGLHESESSPSNRGTAPPVAERPNVRCHSHRSSWPLAPARQGKTFLAGEDHRKQDQRWVFRRERTHADPQVPFGTEFSLWDSCRN